MSDPPPALWGVVGIPEPEQQVYEVLALHAQATGAQLAAEVGMTPARASRILARLAELGLATRLPGRPAPFSPVMPDLAASTLIAAQEVRLRQLREHAQRMVTARRTQAAARHPAELIEVIDGAANVRDAFVRLQQDARSQMRVFDKPPYTSDQPDGNYEEYRLLGEGRVRYRTLYDREGLARPGRMTEVWNGIRHGERARVAGSLPMKMALSDDRLALLPVSASGQSAIQRAYLVHPSSLLNALSELFEAIWEKAVPLNQAATPADEETELTDRDRELLGLLASGTTDETIARICGWSVRTVGRHVRRIMTLVGAQTRFQAGMEASRRGWV